MKNMKRILLTVVSALLLMAVTVVGTVAYLQANTGAVTNTFTVGNVSFTDDLNGGLDEADVDEYGVIDGEARVKANTYKLIPGHTYVKDPTVHVAEDSEEAWLFVKISNEIAAIEADVVIEVQSVDADGNPVVDADGNPVMETKNLGTIAGQMATLGWLPVDSETGVYYYNGKVQGGEDYKVFEYFALATNADVSTYAGKTVKIDAYLIQADNFETAAEAWAENGAQWDFE